MTFSGAGIRSGRAVFGVYHRISLIVGLKALVKGWPQNSLENSIKIVLRSAPHHDAFIQVDLICPNLSSKPVQDHWPPARLCAGVLSQKTRTSSR